MLSHTHLRLVSQYYCVAVSKSLPISPSGFPNTFPTYFLPMVGVDAIRTVQGSSFG